MTRRNRSRRQPVLLPLLALALLGLLAIAPAAGAIAPAPGWRILAATGPTNLPPEAGGVPGTGTLAVLATNVGSAPTDGSTVTVKVGPLPQGIETAASATGNGWTCTPIGAGQETVTCTRGDVMPALSTLKKIEVPLRVTAVAAPEGSTIPVSVEGGGASPDLEGRDTYRVKVKVSAEKVGPGIAALWAGAFDAAGRPATGAGSHPAVAGAGFLLNTNLSVSGNEPVPAGSVRDVLADLPPGFIGDPLATPRCPQAQAGNCYPSLQAELGKNQPLLLNWPGGDVGGNPLAEFVMNDVPPTGYAAQFTFPILQAKAAAFASVRSEGNYGVRLITPTLPTADKISGSFLLLEGSPPGAEGKAFLTNPTDCANEAANPPFTLLKSNSWQEPTVFGSLTDSAPPVTGCRPLTEAWRGEGPEPERPSFEFRPESGQGATGTAVTAHLHIPQEGLTDASMLATSDLKKTVVTLPEGLGLNPSSANGLEACSESQVGYVGPGAMPNPTRFNEEAVTCPDGSKLGNFTVKTPLLEEELEGTIYLAAQEENPFDSLLALYLVVENPRFGLTLKLPGEVTPDPNTGRLTATFDDNPQLPFEDLELHFRGGGPRSELATPEVCGHYATTGSLTPWSAESESPSEAARIEEPGFDVAGNCASSPGARPFSPSFEAGTTGTQAGSYSPLVIKLARKDGEQELRNLEFTLPEGLTGKLAGIPYCPEQAIREAEGRSGRAERSSPSCPSASELGTVDTAAGYGSEPIHVGGHVYLAGPYEGAPLSAVVVTPAVAGPFDLGTVVVRAPLEVNPETTQITAKSDPIPTILRGIPLKLRSVTIQVSRQDFALNPTSCEAKQITARVGSSNGATANPSNRFQVEGCENLPFRPNLKIQLKGATGRIGHPALKAVLTAKPGEADIARAQVNLPHGEFLDQGNLNKTCTKPVLLAGNCPQSSVYGRATAWTPLLDQPLTGNVYLVGGYGYKLPALVAELNGQVRVLLVGKVDSGSNKGIRNTFEVVPDAPVSRFVLEMKGGKKYGLLENSEDLCKASKEARKAVVRLTGQNAKVHQFKPVVTNQCGKGKKDMKKSKQQRPAGVDRRLSGPRRAGLAD